VFEVGVNDNIKDERCILKIFIPVTRRVKGYTRFVGKYVTGRRKRFRAFH